MDCILMKVSLKLISSRFALIALVTFNYINFV